MEKEIEKAIRETLVIKNPESIKYAVKKILGLPSVSKCAQFFNDHLTTSITKCNVCGREKWEHSDVY